MEHTTNYSLRRALLSAPASIVGVDGDVVTLRLDGFNIYFRVHIDELERLGIQVASPYSYRKKR